MSETELTKRIKELTHTYVPKIKSDMRTIRWADEVWTPTGIVDSIRFEDYYRKLSRKPTTLVVGMKA